MKKKKLIPQQVAPVSRKIITASSDKLGEGQVIPANYSDDEPTHRGGGRFGFPFAGDDAE
jgi:prenylated cyclic peptide (anacyclamide/piricyclamide family)